MSGICGLFRRNGEPVTSEPMEKMLGTLRHRGPDGQATWQSGNVGLGHCMLHVTAESLHERLPKCDAKSGYAITADARIDNRKELIATLGREVAEDEPSDSELILAAYRKWGEECPTHLLGDFAFAIVDQARQTVFCASDPVGVKSLYYYLSDREFVFASEIKAVLALPGVPCRLNELRIAEYLVTLFEDLTGTFYEGILRLPGACTLTVTRQSARIGQYWSLDPKRELRLKSDEEYSEAFRELLTEAVRCRTRSVFPVGAALSGGLDSSSIACLARNVKAGNGPLHTFSLIFPGLPEEDRRVIDERPEIQAVLDTGGFEPHPIEADRLSPMWQVERMHYHLDNANCAPNLYLHWAMYNCAQSNGVRVFLDGFDGDSTVSHGFERLAELAQTLRWRELKGEIGLLSENQLRGIKPRRIFKEFCIKPLTPRWAYLVWHVMRGRWREAASQNILIGDALKRRTNIVRRARRLLSSQYRWSITRTARENHWSSISQALYAYTLELADKASAAFSVEARYPFFDRRLMEFCLAIPADQKLGGGWNRWVFRRAMEGILPREIQWRRKKGNLSPNFHRRLLDFERDTLEEVILGRDSSLTPFVDADAMKAAYRQYEKHFAGTQSESIHLFAAVNLALWLRSTGFANQSQA